MRSEVLTAVSFGIQAFCDVTQSHWVGGSLPFKRSSRPHLFRSSSPCRWRNHDLLKCLEPLNPHAAYPIQLAPLTMGQFMPYYHDCPKYSTPPITTVFLTMHHHSTVFWCSITNGNQFRDPITKTFITNCHPIISHWLQSHDYEHKCQYEQSPLKTALMSINF
jgi:hypothetical protein